MRISAFPSPSEPEKKWHPSLKVLLGASIMLHGSLDVLSRVKTHFYPEGFDTIIHSTKEKVRRSLSKHPKKIEEVKQDVKEKVSKGEKIPLGQFYLSTEFAEGAIDDATMQAALEALNSEVARYKAFAADSEDTKKVISKLVAEQGKYSADESYLSTILLNKRGNCQAREKRLSSLVQQVLPDTPVQYQSIKYDETMHTRVLVQVDKEWYNSENFTKKSQPMVREDFDGTVLFDQDGYVKHYAGIPSSGRFVTPKGVVQQLMEETPVKNSSTDDYFGLPLPVAAEKVRNVPVGPAGRNSVTTGEDFDSSSEDEVVADEDMTELTLVKEDEFFLSKKAIEKAKKQQSANNYESLTIGPNIIDISPLITQAPNLKRICLRTCSQKRIDDLGSFSQLEDIKIIDSDYCDALPSPSDSEGSLDCNVLPNLAVLGKLRRLDFLDIRLRLFTSSHESSWDISALGRVRGLKTLILSSNEIHEISALSALTSLEDLNLDYCNQVNDFSPLQKLTNLRYLSLEGTSISDISVLKPLAQLRVLTLNNTGVADLSVLRYLTQLVALNLKGTNVKDISVLRLMPKLKAALNLAGVYGVDLSPIANRTFEYLTIDSSYCDQIVKFNIKVKNIYFLDRNDGYQCSQR